jgi:ubiquinone/menaquinone biosynthesis C-methylase UbiE
LYLSWTGDLAHKKEKIIMSFANFFRSVQDAPWYVHFLNPVLDALKSLPEGAKVLDVGTGPGKLIEFGKKELDLQWVGVDTDKAMLAEARQRPALSDVSLEHLTAGEPLPYADNSFDAVVFCSVLFNITDSQPLLEEAWRVLRPGGKLISLTPTGQGRVRPAALRQIGFSPANSTFFLWRSMTSSSGRAWSQRDILKSFSRAHDADYHRAVVFNELALLEQIVRK